MSYIISCSGKKQCLSNVRTQPSSLQKLYGFPQLYEARKELIEMHGVVLDWNKTVPAYELYKGRLYTQISPKNWFKKDLDVVIVSALFGLIRHNELIPEYDVRIDDRIKESRELISTFWRRKNLMQYLNPNSDIDLLFHKYRKAFNIQGNPIGVTPSVKWHDKYGTHKGRWLNQELEKI